MSVAKDALGMHLLKVSLTARQGENRPAGGPPTEPRSAGINGYGFGNVLAHAGCCTIAADVLAWAVRMAEANSARLDVVHYAPELEAGLESSAGTEATSIDMLGIATRRLTDAVGTARQITGAASGSLSPTTGVPIRNDGLISSLIQEIDDDSADLLVLDAEDVLSAHSRLTAILRSGRHKAGLSILLARSPGPARLRQVTACIDFTPPSLAAARQAMRLSLACGAALRLVCPYSLSSIDLQGIAEAHEYRMELGSEYERRCVQRLRQWLGLSAQDLARIDVACPEVPNWDYRDGLVHALEGEEADLLIVSPRRHSLFAGLQDASLIARIASVVKGSLLVMRR